PRGEKGTRGIPVRAGLSASACPCHARGRPTGDSRPVHRLLCRARRNVRAFCAANERRSCRPCGRRLSRRHDRPFCPARARTVVPARPTGMMLFRFIHRPRCGTLVRPPLSPDPPIGGLPEMLLWILRGSYVAITLGVSLYVIQNYKPDTPTATIVLTFLGIMIIGGSVLALDMLIRDKQITTISAVYFGLLLGLLLGYILSSALESFLSDWFMQVPHWRESLRLFLTVICCYLSVSLLLQTKDEFRFIIPYVEFSKQIKGQKPLVLDTSVIIDGRIADICDTRIIDSK